jgi:hypothetical protein
MRAERVAEGTRPMVEGAAQEVPLERRGAYDFNSGGDYVVFGEQVFELSGELWSKASADVTVEREKAVGEAEIMNAADGGFWGAKWRNEEAKGHGLEWGGSGFGLGDCRKNSTSDDCGRRGGEKCAAVHKESFLEAAAREVYFMVFGADCSL